MRVAEPPGPAGVSRRRRLSPEARRGQLVAAAVEVLAEQGFQAATAEAIARRAGVSKGLLWHYFPDLDGLLEETARETLRALRMAVGSAIDLQAPVPDLIRAAVRVAADMRLTHGPERRALREVVLNLRDAEGRPRLGTADLEELYASQEAIFRRGQDDGDVLATLDPRVLAVTYQGAVDAMLGYLDAHPEADAEQYAATVADVLLAGVTPRAASPRPRGSGRRRPSR